jgi:hypothetical protein
MGDVGLGNVGNLDGNLGGGDTHGNFPDHSMPGGHHGSNNLGGGFHHVGDGNYHSNVDTSQDPHNHWGGLGPSLGDSQGDSNSDTVVNSSRFGDSTSSLLGGDTGHHGYHTMSGLNTHGAVSHPSFGFGITPMSRGRRGGSGLGFGFSFNF